MIVVKVELWPKGDGNRSKELGRAYIANTGTGSKNRADYKVAVCRKGTKTCPWTGKTKAIREGTVTNYPRLSYNMWRLIIRSLLSAFPEEQPK